MCHTLMHAAIRLPNERWQPVLFSIIYVFCLIMWYC